MCAEVHVTLTELSLEKGVDELYAAIEAVLPRRHGAAMYVPEVRAWRFIRTPSKSWLALARTTSSSPTASSNSSSSSAAAGATAASASPSTSSIVGALVYSTTGY